MILVPVKDLANAKQRLSPALSRQERAALAKAMLEDVLEALACCSRRDQVALVTGDVLAQRLAARFAFGVIHDAANPGETGAIDMATRSCVRRGAEFTMVVPGDIPLITAEEVDTVFAAALPAGTVLAPSASGRGTNAVLRCPADLFPLRFGNDSFVPHLAAARATGHPVAVLHLEGIALDVDEPCDLADLLAAPGETRAQRLLREWKIGERLATAATG
jgi:2-phospho-L-lactate guanylyltransferase